MAQKLWVRNMDHMVSFYKEYLGAEILDQEETYSCLKVEDTVLEFYLGEAGSMHLTLQFTNFDSLSECALLVNKHVKTHVKSRSTESQTTYSCVFHDIEGNVVSLIFHQIYVNEYVDVD